MNNTPISVRLPNSTDFDLFNKRVKQHNMTKSAFITMAIDILMEIDPKTFMRLEIISSCLELPMGVVISNLLVGRLHEHDTNKDTKQILSEFVMTRNGILKGQELYEHLSNAKSDTKEV